ncbi:MFS transporter [Kitasatospora sp. NPDC093550]|uniref:MFS transporter n=1 Tax=Kitasatospora sp. NPDC093550 TaxID=3364089 RepID=UPI0038166D32
MSSAPSTPRTGSARRLSRLLPEPGPGRTLYYASLVSTLGTGMYLASSAIFLVSCAGLSAASVGLGLTLGGGAGLVAGMPVGRLADRREPRNLFIAVALLQGAAMVALLFVHSLWAFALVSAVTGAGGTAQNVARNVLIRAAAPEGASVLRAHIRSIANVGITAGGAVAGVVIAWGDSSLYPVLVVGNAVSFVGCALLGARLPATRRAVTAQEPTARTRGSGVLRDRPYLAVTANAAVLMFQVPVLPLILPLWVYQHTSLPHWLVATAIPLNTVMVAALQVRLSRKAGDNRSAAALMPRAGAAFLAAFALLGFIGGVPAWGGACLLVAAVVLYTLGEIWQSIGSYELSLNLAPHRSQGEYFGFYTTGMQVGRVVSSTVVTFLCLGLGTVGWWLLGLLMLVASLPMPAVARRAESAVPAEAPGTAGAATSGGITGEVVGSTAGSD